MGSTVRWSLGSVCALALMATSCVSHGDSDEVNRERCEALRDHLVDLRLADVGQPTMAQLVMPSPGTMDPPAQPVDLAKHRAAMRQALGEAFLATCQQRWTASQLTCTLAARDSAAATACSTSPRTASK